MSIYQWTKQNYISPPKQNLDISNEIQDIVKEMLYGDKNVIRVNSLAGTGKTTLLSILSQYYIAKNEAQRGNIKFSNTPNVLYLASLKRLVNEAKELFDYRVRCHSLTEIAIKYTKRYKNCPNYSSIEEYKAEIFVNYFNIKYDIACEINDILNNWLNSYDTEEGIQNYAYGSRYSSEAAFYAHTYVTDARCFEEGTYVTNKFILKELQLQLREGMEINLKDEVDLLLVDEGQDLSDAAIYVFLNFPAKKRVIVGDTNQKIYPYVSNNNALLKDIDDMAEFHLTSSYRHSHEVAEKANYILKTYKDSKHSIKPKQQIKTKYIRPNGYIYRWTSGAMEGIILAKESKAESIECAQEVLYLLELIISFDLVDNKQEPLPKFNNAIDFIQKHKNKLEKNLTLIQYIRDFLPNNLYKGNLAQIKIVLKKYDIKTIKSLYNFSKKFKESSLKPDITITSIFKSKGFEFETITILSDMPDLAEVVANYFIFTKQTYKKGEKFDYISFFSEYIHKKETIYNTSSVAKWTYPINLYYTAITRARTLVNDRSINKNYYNKEELNKAIYKFIKKTK